VAGVTFSDFDSNPVPKFLNPDPGPAIFQIWESESCSTIIHPTLIYPCFYLRNDHKDSCNCRNWEVTTVQGPLFPNFLTPGLDPGLKEKRKILPESTPVHRIWSHLCHPPVKTNNPAEIISILFAGWLSALDTDIQKRLSNGNWIQIRISEKLFLVFRFRFLKKVAHYNNNNNSCIYKAPKSGHVALRHWTMILREWHAKRIQKYVKIH